MLLLRSVTVRRPSRWTQTLRELPVLSVRQPYAWLIIAGGKNIENRTRRTHYRGPILIHAGLAGAKLSTGERQQLEELAGGVIPEAELLAGGIIGVVDVIDCVVKSESPWWIPNHWGWVLANPRPLPFHPCRGSLGFFRIE